MVKRFEAVFSVLGDRVLIGPQTFATVINVPEHNMVLVQMQLVPGQSKRQHVKQRLSF